MKNKAQIDHLLNPTYLQSVAGLELLARATLQGITPGFQPSLRTGPGQEFSQYRSYQPGDDFRRLDWKLYSRSDRYFVREAETETNLNVRFVLDASASMLHEDQHLPKIAYARYLIATLAWLANQQGDTTSLYALSDKNYYDFNPRPGRQYFLRFLHELLQVECKGYFPKIKPAHPALQSTPGRELILFITDMHESKSELTNAIRNLTHSGNEIIVFHILGQNELELDFPGVSTFEDLETGRRIQVDTRQQRSRYRREVENHIQHLRRQMLQWGVSYQLLIMREHLGEALRTFLKKRKGGGS